MSTSSCMGSQLVNICLGLGMSWFVSSAMGVNVQLGRGDALIFIATWAQLLNIVIVFSCTVGWNYLKGRSTLRLTKRHSWFFIGLYLLFNFVFVAVAFWGPASPSNVATDL